MNLSYESLKSILRIYVRLTATTHHVDGGLPLPPGPKIIAANHTYATDAFHLPLIVREQLHFLMQGSMFANPLAAKIFEHAGQIEVNRDQCGVAFQKALRLLEQGGTVVIYPEGRLTPPGTHYPGHTGAICLAQASGAPIIPLGTHVDPRHLKEVRFTLHGRARSGLWQLGGACNLLFGEPWHPAHANARVLTDELMERIYSLVNQIPKESICASPTSPNPIRPWSAARPSSPNVSPKG